MGVSSGMSTGVIVGISLHSCWCSGNIPLPSIRALPTIWVESRVTNTLGVFLLGEALFLSQLVSLLFIFETLSQGATGNVSPAAGFFGTWRGDNFD